MALADNLLVQAYKLATMDAGIPAQANLRRAVCSAYYALFHQLVAAAVGLLIPGTLAGLRARVSRSFQHNEMKRVCSRFAALRPSDDLASLPGTTISPQLLSVVQVFESLQQWRHIADYDVAFSFLRADALSSVREARQAFADWATMSDSDEATVFLAALAFGARRSR